VKVIRVEKGQDPSFLKRFERESKALARLSHPNIVHVNDYGEQDGVPYLVMDYVPGGTLKQKLGKPVPFQEAAKIMIPMAHALYHAHVNGIVHRDVKPANVLMTAGGEPMLSDFGIAKLLEGEQTTELTGTGVGIGTPEYMAPEQGTGEKVDERADIYSLGVVFYELITGRKPFRADTPMAVVIKHITEPLPRPDSFVQGLPDEVNQIVFKAMAKRPEDRYQTMEQFAQALERLLQVSPLPFNNTLSAAQPLLRGAEPKMEVKKKAPLPIMGTLLGVGVVLAILGLLTLCVVVVAYRLNSITSSQAAPTITQLQASQKSKSTGIATPFIGKLTPSVDPGSIDSLPTPTGMAENPQTTPTSEQMTFSSNGTTMVILANRKGSLSAGDTKDLGDVTLPSGVGTLLIYFSWDAGSLEGVVFKPDGSRVNAKTQDAQLFSNSSMSGYTMINPPAGKWKFTIQNVKTTSDKLNYTFMVQYTDKNGQP
jgi:serine/threonine protein kinase